MYKVKDNEKHLFHVKLTKRENNPKLQKYEDKEDIQKFTAKDFHELTKTKFLAQNYNKVEVLHNPEVETKNPKTASEKKKEKNELADLQIQYKAKYNEDADPELTIDELKELLS